MKFFRVKLDIGIAGDVAADHFVVSDGLLRFYSSKVLGVPVAVYALASVSSVEEVQPSRADERRRRLNESNPGFWRNGRS